MSGAMEPTTWEEAARQAAARIPSLTHAVRHRVGTQDLASADEWLRRVQDSFRYVRDDPKDETSWLVLACGAFGGFMALTYCPWESKDAVLHDLLQTLADKQFDYGHDNINEFGVGGLVVRVHDKIARLRNLMGRRIIGGPRNEGLMDTWLDIAGYCVIAMMLLRETFNLPLSVDAAPELPPDEERPQLFDQDDEARADVEASRVQDLYDFLFGDAPTDFDGTITVYILGEAA